MRLEELLAVGPNTAPEELFLDLPEEVDAPDPEPSLADEDLLELPSEEEREEEQRWPAWHDLNWLVEAKEGQRLIYHEGFLMNDRLNNRVVHLTGLLFHKAAERGLVQLTQEKCWFHHYFYYARRTAFLMTPSRLAELEAIIQGVTL